MDKNLELIEFPELELDIAAFDVNLELEEMYADNDMRSTRIKTSTTPLRRYARTPMRQVRYRNAETLAKETPDLAQGEAMYVLVAGAFIFGDYIEALAVAKNYQITEMIIATLSLGLENVDSLNNLIQGDYVDHIGLIVSDYWYAHEYRSPKGGVSYINHTLGDHVTLAAAGLHTKVTLIKTACGKHIVIHGSANLRSSQNLEQFCIENNPELYAFNREWMASILRDYSQTGTRKRGNKLWLHLTEPTQSND